MAGSQWILLAVVLNVTETKDQLVDEILRLRHSILRLNGQLLVQQFCYTKLRTNDPDDHCQSGWDGYVDAHGNAHRHHLQNRVTDYLNEWHAMMAMGGPLHGLAPSLALVDPIKSPSQFPYPHHNPEKFPPVLAPIPREPDTVRSILLSLRQEDLRKQLDLLRLSVELLNGHRLVRQYRRTGIDGQHGWDGYLDDAGKAHEHHVQNRVIDSMNAWHELMNRGPLKEARPPLKLKDPIRTDAKWPYPHHHTETRRLPGASPNFNNAHPADYPKSRVESLSVGPQRTFEYRRTQASYPDAKYGWLGLDWVGMIDNGEGDGDHGPYGSMHLMVRESGGIPLVHYYLPGPSKDEWLDFDEKSYRREGGSSGPEVPCLHVWRSPKDSVWLEVWESDPMQGVGGIDNNWSRDHDFVFVMKISPSDFPESGAITDLRNSSLKADKALFRRIIWSDEAIHWGGRAWPPEWLFRLFPEITEPVKRIREGQQTFDAWEVNVPSSVLRLAIHGKQAS